ncbi:MAG TPA: glycosyltransferase [Candidatus Sulfotelmatobacter sp.]|nr:glycosyltransferase [Candidatus Sulfotelmatobacter sp.]
MSADTVRVRPTISVVITSYNYERFLGQAIESVLSQEYPALELVVVDNASTDGSRAVMERYASDPRVRLIFNAENVGRNANHNIGWRHSGGEYVVFLSADDFLLPGHLDALEDLVHRYPGADLTYARAVEVDAEGRPIRVNELLGVIEVEEYGPGRNEFADLLASSSSMWLPTMLLRRSFLDETGGFDESVNVAADFDLQLRLIAMGKKVAFLNRALVCIRFHGTNPSGEHFMRSGDLVRDFARIYERVIAAHPDLVREREFAITAMLRGYLRNVAPEHRAATARDCGPAIAQIGALLQASDARPFPTEPLVSVVIPTAGKRIGELLTALESVRAQTYAHWEAVVVNDGDADLSAVFARYVGEPRLRFVRAMGGGGPASARNAALRLAAGTVVAYLDDDDRFAPTHLATLVTPIVAGADVALADVSLLVEARESHFSGRLVPLASVAWQYPTETWGAALAVAPCVPLVAVAHRRSLVDRYGPFAAGLAIDEGWDFLARIAPQTRAAFTHARTAERHWRPAVYDQIEAGRLPHLAASVGLVHQRAAGEDGRLAPARAAYLAALAACVPSLREPTRVLDGTVQLAGLAMKPWLQHAPVLETTMRGSQYP